jgi:hypothetical protein
LPEAKLAEPETIKRPRYRKLTYARLKKASRTAALAFLIGHFAVQFADCGAAESE